MPKKKKKKKKIPKRYRCPKAIQWILCKLLGHKYPKIRNLTQLFNAKCKRCNKDLLPDKDKTQSLIPYRVYIELLG